MRSSTFVGFLGIELVSLVIALISLTLLIRRVLMNLGTTSALGDILGVRFSGLLGALVWKGVYLYELGYNLNRVRVLADWVVDLFAQPDISRFLENLGQLVC